ncbi:MAG: hypothetical protein ACLFU0_09105 [Alphaproteobacteria bacterium]
MFGRLVIAAAVAGVLSLVHHVGADTRRARELPSGLSGTAGGLFAVLVRAELRRHGRDA